MRFIGITGGIGAGKSELLNYIGKHYCCEIYLADEVAHEVKKKGTKCYDQLIRLLGTEVLGEDGEIDKRKMASRIFADQELLSASNAIIHPAVKDYLLEHLKTAGTRGDVELFFVEAALLIESGYKELVDEMWYIHADKNVRIERLKAARGYSDEKIAQIMESQLSEEAFRKSCDFEIENNGNLEESFRRIDKKLEAYTWKE